MAQIFKGCVVSRQSSFRRKEKVANYATRSPHDRDDTLYAFYNDYFAVLERNRPFKFSYQKKPTPCNLLSDSPKECIKASNDDKKIGFVQPAYVSNFTTTNSNRLNALFSNEKYITLNGFKRRAFGQVNHDRTFSSTGPDRSRGCESNSHHDVKRTDCVTSKEVDMKTTETNTDQLRTDNSSGSIIHVDHSPTSTDSTTIITNFENLKAYGNFQDNAESVNGKSGNNNRKSSDIPKTWKKYNIHVDKLDWVHYPDGDHFAFELVNTKPSEFQNGIEISYFTPDTILPIYNLDILPYLFTRNDSRAITETIYDHLISKDNGDRHAILYGNPGIGKSVGCLLNMLKILLMKKKLVYYHLMRTSDMYAFIPPSHQDIPNTGENYQVYYVGECDAKSTSVVAGLRDPDAFYLVDVDELHQPQTVKAHTIIASSPDEERLKLHDKEYTKTFYLPMWTLEELKTLFENFPNFHSVPSIQEKFRYVNGNLRAMLNDSNYEKTILKQSDKLSDVGALEVLYNAVFNSKGLLLKPDKYDSAKSTTLFAYSAEYPYTSKKVHVVSQYVMDSIIIRNYDVSYRNSVLSTSAWEKFCLLAIARGGAFEMWDYQSMAAYKSYLSRIDEVKLSDIHSKSDLLAEWKKLPFRHTTEKKNQAASSATSYAPFKPIILKSDKTNFPLIDFVCFKDVAYNPTITRSAKKLPSAETILRLSKELEISTLHLYHCVPQIEFDEFTKKIPVIRSNYKDTKKARKAEAMAEKILKQHVIKISETLNISSSN